jgi:hypothetical protein
MYRSFGRPLTTNPLVLGKYFEKPVSSQTKSIELVLLHTRLFVGVHGLDEKAPTAQTSHGWHDVAR